MSFASSRRPALVVGLVSLSVAGVAAVPASAADYPAKVDKAFLKTCEKAAISAGKVSKSDAQTYCETALHCLERKLTLKQFIQGEATNSSRYKKAVKGCIAEGKKAIS
jgi:hypothetical protein